MNMQPLPNTATKAEEIQYLNKIVELIGPSTYLKDLFNARALAWVEREINNDFTPDFMGLYEAEEEKRRQVEKELDALRIELDKQTRSAKRQAEEATAALTEARKINDYYSEKENRSLKVYSDLLSKYEETDAELNTAINAIKERDAIITDLKVKLYDLQNR